MRVTLLAGGGGDIYYELGLCSGLVSAGVHVNYIGSDAMSHADILRNEKVAFLNLRGSQNPNTSFTNKVFRIIRYYLRLIKYTWKTETNLFHIQWPNKFIYFDRTVLILYYKVLGKKLVFTAHNVNAGIRDGNDNLLNRLTLKFMYRMVDHIIVHTDKMKDQLLAGFGVRPERVSVISYGINNMVFSSDLTGEAARRKLNLNASNKVLLFFGIITPYKGLEFALIAIELLKRTLDNIKLIVAGKVDATAKKYWKRIERMIVEHDLSNCVEKRIGFIPDQEIEVFFKAADALVLPYRYIFQSGVLFLSYNFGLPVIAADVGSLRDFIIDGKTGYVCKPEDPYDLAAKINHYYQSDLYRTLESNRREIIKHAYEKYSWTEIGRKTRALYESLI